MDVGEFLRISHCFHDESVLIVLHIHPLLGGKRVVISPALRTEAGERWLRLSTNTDATARQGPLCLSSHSYLAGSVAWDSGTVKPAREASDSRYHEGY